MKFWEENAFMASVLDECFKHGWLVLEIILLTEKTGQAAVLIINQTHWRALGS